MRVSFDITYLSCLPGMVVMAASDEGELVHMVSTAVAYDDGPCAFRYPRGEGVGVDLPLEGIALPIGKGRILREGSKVALLNFGARLQECLKAAEELESHGLSATVADARFSKPLDEDLIGQLGRHHEVLITIEEGSIGGFSSQVFHFLSHSGLLDGGLKVPSDGFTGCLYCPWESVGSIQGCGFDMFGYCSYGIFGTFAQRNGFASYFEF